MKKCNILLISILITVTSLISVFTTGCIALSVKSFMGNWQLDFDKTYPQAKQYFENVYLTISKTDAMLSIEFSDYFKNNGYSCEFSSGEYNITYVDHSDYSLGFTLSRNDTELHGWTTGNTLGINNCTIFASNEDTGEDIDEEVDITLYFTKSNKAPSSDSDGNTNAESKFEEIKEAYKDAGYSVDLGEDGLDSATAQLVKSMSDMYSALGYDISVIGKNLSGDNVLSIELYMLISTPTEQETQEIIDAFKDGYKYAVNGKDVIISIWLTGTANFTPFNNATK